MAIKYLNDCSTVCLLAQLQQQTAHHVILVELAFMFTKKGAMLTNWLMVCLLAAVVLGHSKLTIPAAWNPNPSTTQPCGGGVAPNGPVVTYTQGNTYPLQWVVVASDGNGPITVSLDTNGGTTAFSVPVTVAGVMPATGTKTYNFNITIPNVSCSGANGKCTMQVKSTSGWYACSSVAITSAVSTPSPAPSATGTCMKATGLTFCDSVNGNDVLVPFGQTDPITMDNVLRGTFNNNLNNPAVFATPNATFCQSNYKKFLCGRQFQPCDGSYLGGCNQACVALNSICSIKEVHIPLYPCDSYPNTKSDNTGSCSGAGSLRPPIILFVVLFLLYIMN
ncbi:hypothetical protein AKO1_009347 [Acrasis kona]|uniref:Uncharacterized protein n=1 Tax=Acrasis kona TaxID=1008807 RepID=A0AAW2ZK99_9EUKA